MKNLKVVSWNVNSINVRLQHIAKLIAEECPDVLLLQELKCVEEKFPYRELEDMGYNCYAHCQKSYNGVAILSKTPVEDIKYGLYADEEARFIAGYVSFNGKMIKVISVYVPNGADPQHGKFSYKMEFFEQMRDNLATECNNGEKIILGGDLNVAPEPIDVYNPKGLDGKIGFHVGERRWFRRIEEVGYHDSYRLLNNREQEFSWWDYRTKGWENGRGMRIDHILISSHLLNNLVSAGICAQYRGLEKPSDHAPIYVVIASCKT